ncbi:MAG TPA: M20/M25/M40 family metallo-hydrolase [Thermoanaerobaculia bacterium]|nr:M20/M25/M40 family metallo-hydrolase [Thermoanaerobaculia bacterium]
MRPPRLAGLLLLTALLAALPGRAEVSASEATSWLQRYLAIDTTNPPGNEHRAVEYLAWLLHRERIPTEWLKSPEGRVSLLARLPAENPRGGPLLLTHHMDVVPAGPGWTVAPFSAEIRDGELWGRGALDTKALGIAHLAAMIDLKRRGVPLERDVVFLAVADEEKGGGQGMAWLVEAHPEVFEGVWAAFNEGGSGRRAATGLLWWEVEVAQKRPLWLRLSVEGRSGHASQYRPSSAPHTLIRALARVLDRPPTYRVTPVVRRYFQAIAPLHEGSKWRALFADIDRVVTPSGPSPKLLPGLDRLFLDSLQVTVLAGSESINVIPREASAEIDVRLLPDTDADAYLAELAGMLGREVKIEVLARAPVSAPSPTDHPAFRAIEETLGSSAPVVPALLSGFTDSRFLRERGIPAYGVSPFDIDPLSASGVHGPDERISVVGFERGVERMIRLVERCARR